MAKKNEMQYYEGVGRRKDAVARVRLYLTTSKEKSATVGGQKVGQGEVIINGKPLDKALSNPVDRKRFMLPFELADSVNRFAVSIKVIGGGPNGQVEAMMHGVARALTLSNEEEYRPLFKEHNLLTRDPRTRERRKVGTGGKARRAKQSPKR